MSAHRLTQLNIDVMKDSMDSPVMADFAGNLDRINALAESLPAPDAVPSPAPVRFNDECPAV